MIYAKKEELSRAQDTGDAVETLRLVKKVIYSG